MSIIAVEGMRFYAHHGYYAKERVLGSYYTIDVYVETNFDWAAESDELEGTVNYEIVYQICAEEMKIAAQLLEHLAHRILKRLIETLSKINHLKIRVAKIAPPLAGPVERTYVEMERKLK